MTDHSETVSRAESPVGSLQFYEDSDLSPFGSPQYAPSTPGRDSSLFSPRLSGLRCVSSPYSCLSPYSSLTFPTPLSLSPKPRRIGDTPASVSAMRTPSSYSEGDIATHSAGDVTPRTPTMSRLRRNRRRSSFSVDWSHDRRVQSPSTSHQFLRIWGGLSRTVSRTELAQSPDKGLRSPAKSPEFLQTSDTFSRAVSPTQIPREPSCSPCGSSCDSSSQERRKALFELSHTEALKNSASHGGGICESRTPRVVEKVTRATSSPSLDDSPFHSPTSDSQIPTSNCSNIGSSPSNSSKSTGKEALQHRMVLKSSNHFSLDSSTESALDVGADDHRTEHETLSHATGGESRAPDNGEPQSCAHKEACDQPENESGLLDKTRSRCEPSGEVDMSSSPCVGFHTPESQHVSLAANTLSDAVQRTGGDTREAAADASSASLSEQKEEVEVELEGNGDNDHEEEPPEQHGTPALDLIAQLKREISSHEREQSSMLQHVLHLPATPRVLAHEVGLAPKSVALTPGAISSHLYLGSRHKRARSM